jgi:hypothetical protein
MPDVRATSIAAERRAAHDPPTTGSVELAARDFARAFGEALGAPVSGP